jgi:SPX domain protein involved in polyphosphate accumulation
MLDSEIRKQNSFMDVGLSNNMNDGRQVGVELLQLLQFVELNATALRKILKKFDKRVGFRLGAQYIASRSNHPYSQLQLVFRQVVRLF